MNPVLTDVLRVFIVTGGIAAALLIVGVNWRGRRDMTSGQKLTRAGTIVLALTVAYATLETAVQHLPGGPRLWVLAVALVWLNAGLVVTLIERRTRP